MTQMSIFVLFRKRWSLILACFFHVSILNKVKCFIKKRDSDRSFPENFAKILGTPILKDICEMLLPYIEIIYEILIIKSSLLKGK